MRPIPAKPEIEKQVLGDCIAHPAACLRQAMETINDEFFHVPAHQEIYRLLVEMDMEQEPIELVSVTTKLRDAGMLDRVGGPAFISELYTLASSPANFRYYADILREVWLARKAIQAGERIASLGYEASASASELVEAVQQGLMEFSSVAESRTPITTTKTLVMRAIDRYGELFDNRGKPQGLTTGFHKLDKHIRGMRAAQMIVIGAETKGGKTALAGNIAEHVAVDCGEPVGIFSLEMSGDELIDRAIAARARMDISCLSSGLFNEGDFPKLIAAGQEIGNAPIFVRDEASMNLMQFRAAARKLRMQHKVKLIVLDYAQLVEPTGSDDNREREVAKISRTVKTTAKELGIPIIVLTQLNEDGRTRESRAIEQDADLVLVIRNPKPDDPLNRLRWLDIRYARHCPKGKIPLTYFGEFTRFENCQYEPDPNEDDPKPKQKRGRN